MNEWYKTEMPFNYAHQILLTQFLLMGPLEYMLIKRVTIMKRLECGIEKYVISTVHIL